MTDIKIGVNECELDCRKYLNYFFFKLGRMEGRHIWEYAYQVDDTHFTDDVHFREVAQHNRLRLLAKIRGHAELAARLLSNLGPPNRILASLTIPPAAGDQRRATPQHLQTQKCGKSPHPSRGCPTLIEGCPTLSRRFRPHDSGGYWPGLCPGPLFWYR
jgi:hypothetical protein